MPIQTIAHYRVKPSAVDKVRQAIANFVVHVRANEPGTKLYVAWQQKDDPTRFVHFFIFEDAAAHAVHASSTAVKQFEAAYGPELAEGSVVFTDYEVVAAKGIGE
jgi:quinol monooxygenase YgiN